MFGIDVLMKQELLPVTNYLPDMKRITTNGVLMRIGVGEWTQSKNLWNANVCRVLANQLGCDVVRFPASHGGYIEDPEGFAAVLRGILREIALQ